MLEIDPRRAGGEAINLNRQTVVFRRLLAHHQVGQGRHFRVVAQIGLDEISEIVKVGEPSATYCLGKLFRNELLQSLFLLAVAKVYGIDVDEDFLVHPAGFRLAHLPHIAERFADKQE